MAEADREWLKQQLAAALGWDPAVAEGIVQAIATAESQDEVEELLQVKLSDLKPDPQAPVSRRSSRCKLYGLAHQNRHVEALHPNRWPCEPFKFQPAPMVSMQTSVNYPAVVDAASGCVRQYTGHN